MLIKFLYESAVYFYVAQKIVFSKSLVTITGAADDDCFYSLPISNTAEAQKEFELLVMHRGNINAYFDITKYQAAETPATE